jgi:hypothetical protein
VVLVITSKITTSTNVSTLVDLLKRTSRLYTNNLDFIIVVRYVLDSKELLFVLVCLVMWKL